MGLSDKVDHAKGLAIGNRFGHMGLDLVGLDLMEIKGTHLLGLSSEPMLKATFRLKDGRIGRAGFPIAGMEQLSQPAFSRKLRILLSGAAQRLGDSAMRESTAAALAVTGLIGA